MAEEKLKYKTLIIAVSVIVPLLVALLFGVRVPNVAPLTILPPIYATINGITASIFLSLLFLVMYVAYHMTSDSTPYGGDGFIRYVYFFILITHITLSIGIIPMVLVTYVRAISKHFGAHKKIARITFPIWLYIAVTGVVVYLMIAPYYA